MSHTIRDKARLIARVRRIRGQVTALESALDEEQACTDVLHQLVSIRGAVHGLMAQVLEGQLREHVAAPGNAAERGRGADELLAVLRSYLK